MMFKQSFAITLLLVFAYILEIISTTTLSTTEVSSPRMSSNSMMNPDAKTSPDSTIMTNPRTSLHPPTKPSNLNPKMTPTAKQTLNYIMTSSLLINITTPTGGSTILNPVFSSHGLFFVTFLLLCVLRLK